MGLSQEQLLERMTRPQLVARMKSRRKRGGRTNVVVIGGKVRHVTSKMRKSFRKAAAHLRRLAKNAGARRRAAKTKKIYARLMHKKPYTTNEVTHSPEFICAATVLAERTGMLDVGQAMLEHISPLLTNTQIGVYALEVSEKLDTTPSVSSAYIDCVVIDENTVGFYFENQTGLNEATIERALAEFGTPTVLAIPGKKISEEQTSDFYAVALSVKEDKLSKVEIAERYNYDEHDEPQLDEAANLSEEDTETICRNPVFAELNKMLAE